MRILGFIICLSLFLVLFGCVNDDGTGGKPDQTNQSGSKSPECKVITITEPYDELMCWNITYTEEVCDKKALEYTVSKVDRFDLCTDSGGCAGMSIVDCESGCDFAMKRCRMNITNNDKDLAGVWVVGANFTVDGNGFIKDPITQTIKAGELYTFDITQLYNVGRTGSSVDCELFVIESPVVEDCHMESTVTPQCKSVTSYKEIQKESCN